MFSLALVTLVAGTLSTPVLAASVVQGKAVRADVRNHIDRRLTLDDVFSGTTARFGSDDAKAGLRASDFIKISLGQSRLWGYLPRSTANEKLVEGLQPGDPITLDCVIEARRIDGRNFTEIPISIPDRTHVFVRVRSIRVGAAQTEPVFMSPAAVKADDYVEIDVDEVAFSPENFADNDVVLTRRLPHFKMIRRYYSTWERSQGLDKKTALKIEVGLGFPLFIARTPENIEAVKSWGRGTKVRFYGNMRVHNTASSDTPILVVQRFEVLAHAQKTKVRDL